ncbi:MAG: hypothetical protein K2J60_01660 [Acetatifactor sp.]|nr:hypothetical protein [Acetatifactor sp.]
MSWKKNVLSYLLWVFYAVTAEVGLVCLADAVCDSMEMEIYIGTIACALYIIVAGVGVYLIHRFLPKYSGADGRKHSLRTVIETTVTVILLATGFALRIREIGAAVEGNVYYELAVMVFEEEIPQFAHSAVYIYIRMLHGLFYFLGNKLTAAVWVQILLQMSALLLLYFAVRQFAGNIAAIVMLGFGVFSSYLSDAASNLSPAMLYFFLWSAALLLTVTAARAKKSLWGFPAVGLAISVVSYLDVAGCLLLLIFAAVIFSEKEVPGTGRRLKCLLLCFMGAGVGFVSCALTDFLMSGKSFTAALTGWFQLYRPLEFRLPVSVAVPGTMTEVMAEYIILFCVLTLGMFSFWRDRRSDHMKAWILLLIILVSAGCFGIFTEEVPMGLYMYLFLTIMAGIAVEECIREVKPAQVVAQISAAAGSLIESAVVPQQVREAASGGETVSKQYGEANAAQQTDGEAAPQPRKVKLIENPLPLPKKHVRKKLDYGVNVPAGKDDFDLDVDEKDDFDI